MKVSNIPISFFCHGLDDPALIWKEISGRIDAMRTAQKNRLCSLTRAIDQLLKDFQEEQREQILSA
jgi:hypothetical protein